MARVLINVPPTAKRGQIIEIKALISHPMETGFRTGPDGNLVPRNIIKRIAYPFSSGRSTSGRRRAGG
jgi:sulfur-oxidizing protein SoxZ